MARGGGRARTRARRADRGIRRISGSWRRALVGYFGAFNFLEARLPASLAEAAGEESRGAAMGVFATCQFAGAFAGGLAGGALLGSPWASPGVFLCAALAVLGWLPWAAATESRRNGSIDAAPAGGGRLQ